MPDPRDPDTEDRRPDEDRGRSDDDEAEAETEVEAEAERADRWMYDDGEMIDYDLDDLRGMEGPDA